MGVHDVGVARGPRAPRGRSAARKSGSASTSHGPRAQVLDDPGAEGDPEVREVGGRDDVDLDARAARSVLDELGDEGARRRRRGSAGRRS